MRPGTAGVSRRRSRTEGSMAETAGGRPIGSHGDEGEDPPLEEELDPLGQRVRALRLGQKLSLSEVARLSGVSKGYLSQVERSPTARPSAPRCSPSPAPSVPPSPNCLKARNPRASAPPPSKSPTACESSSRKRSCPRSTSKCSPASAIEAPRHGPKKTGASSTNRSAAASANAASH